MFKHLITNIKKSHLIPLTYHNNYAKMQKIIIKQIILNHPQTKCYYIDIKGIVTSSIKNILKTTVDYTSGIYQPPLNFYTDLHMLDISSKMIHKFIHSMLSGAPLKTNLDILLRIDNFLKIDPTLNIINYYPYAQHIVVCTCAHFTFSSQIFKLFGNNLIDYSEYDQESLQGINAVEAVVINNVILNNSYLKTENMQIIAQNPKFNKEIHTIASYKQGKQPFMDFRIKLETSQNKTFFFDSKLITNPVQKLSLTKGHISLSTSIDYNVLMTRFSSDIVTSTTQSNNIPLIEKNIMKKSNQQIINSLKNKAMSPLDRVDLYNSVVRNILEDPRITATIPSIIIIPKNNISYGTYVNETMTEYVYALDIIKEELVKNDLLKELIPIPNDKQQVHVVVWHDLLLNVIKRYPKELQKNLLDNFHKFKLLEYGHDF